MPNDTPIPLDEPVQGGSQTLIDYLRLSLASYQASIKLIHEGKIQVNGAIVRDPQTVVNAGDKIQATEHIRL